MKRASRKRPARKPAPPTPDQIRQHIHLLVDAHQCEWHNELLTNNQPDWSHLLCLHLRMVELSQIEAGNGRIVLKRAAFYLRVSTLDQNAQTQVYDLRELARQRNLEVAHEYRDEGVSGARVRRPALDRMMADARQRSFEVVLVWASDRLARSTRHFLETLDELNRLGIEFVSFRENMDTGGPLGRAIITIVSAVAELERSLIRERVRAGMRRARLEGQRLGRPRIVVDREAILQDRARGLSLGELAKRHGTSRTTIRRLLVGVPKGLSRSSAQTNENSRPRTAA